MKLRSLWITFLFLPGGLWAYQPLAWSPLDAYIAGTGETAGPRALEVRDAEGQIIETARFQYDGAGHLVREEYFDARNVSQGFSQYEYAGGRLVKEILRNASAVELVRKEFEYDSNGRLNTMSVFNKDGERIQTQTYTYSSEHIVSGTEQNSGEQLRFLVSYNADRPREIAIKDGEATISEISILYDEQGRVSQRIRKQPNQTNRFVYDYDNQNRVTGYEYQHASGDDWVTNKVARFVY
ncbi:MAG: hypothetical protein KDK30_01620 [Leptospiraceae bacterium]|nr:hypothetical protein [Leptospiraceae bacterium]